MIEEIAKKLGPKWTFKLFKVIKTLYLILDFILTSIIDYSLVNGRQKKDQNAKLSGHLVNIIGRCTDNPVGQVNLDQHFILQHNSYIDPIDFVTKNDFVTLMGASKTHAWFCVSPNFDVYDSSIIPFAFLAQYLNAQKLLIVDHLTLHETADKLQSPQGKCIMINNTSRSGSTLLCQIFKKIPNTLVQSEPWSFLYLHRLYNTREISWTEYQSLIESFVKLQFKATAQTSTELYVIKLPFLCGAMFEHIKTIFGDKIRFLFSVRHLKASVTSFVKLLKSLDTKDFQDKNDFWSENVPLPYQEKYRPMYKKYYNKRRNLTDVEKVTLASGAVLVGFRKNLHMYDFVAIYEELMENIEKKVTEMFKAFEIPISHVHEAIKVLDTDYQLKMFDGRHKVEEVDAQEWKKANRILEELELPFRTEMSTDQFIASL